MTGEAGRSAQVLQVLKNSRLPLDDDQLAFRTGINRHYVNRICRDLAVARLVRRVPGADGKLVNEAIDADSQAALGSQEQPGLPPRHPLRGKRKATEDRARRQVEDLIATFDQCVESFERQEAFPGPSLYFHEGAIAARRRHGSAESLLGDIQFLEYVYAVLPAWGMHRMGAQRAKVNQFTEIVTGLRASVRELDELWPLRITDLTGSDLTSVARAVWSVIDRTKASTSLTQLVAGSKTIHHLLPDLVPPIDREYTFRFFTGQKAVPSDRDAFLSWFPLLAEIGERRQQSIWDTLARGGYMATGEAKIIDNAIVGYVLRSRRPAPNL